jgi:hypothetical protein
MRQLEACRKFREQIPSETRPAWTYLHSACHLGHEQAAAILLRNGSPIHAREGLHGETPVPFPNTLTQS